VWGGWLRARGATGPPPATGLPAQAIEVSPLFGYDAETFAESWQKLPAKPPVVEGLYLE
jgi:UDP-N-acetylglucosamine/UDP-N-acetylgalactosamine diphosphorylase